MKTPNCYVLIKSLTKSEKIYFKTYLSSSAKNDESIIYIKLFDELDKMKSYDENIIKNKFKEENFTKHLATSYNYLYHLLLKRVSDYYVEKKENLYAYKQLQNIEFLLSKRLFSQATAQIKKYKKVFIKKKLDLQLFMSLRLEYNLSVMEMKKDQFDNRIEICNDRKELLQKIDLSNDLLLSNNQIIKLSNNKEKLDAETFENEIKAITKKIEYIRDKVKILDTRIPQFYSNMIGYYELLGENDKAYESSRLQLDNSIKQSDDCKKNSLNLSIYIFNHLNRATDYFDAEEIFKYLPFLKKIAKNNSNIKSKCELIDFHFLLKAYYYQNQTDKLKESLAFYYNKKTILEKNNVPFYQIRMFYDFVFYNFMLENYDEALDHINIVSKYNQAVILDVFEINARLIEIIIHFEKQHHSLVESLCKKLKRKISKERNKKSNKFLNYFLNQILKACTLFGHGRCLNHLISKILESDEKYELDDSIQQITLVWLKSRKDEISKPDAFQMLVNEYEMSEL